MRLQTRVCARTQRRVYVDTRRHLDHYSRKGQNSSTYVNCKLHSRSIHHDISLPLCLSLCCSFTAAGSVPLFLSSR